MKKFFAYTLIVLLLATQVPTVWAAGSASVKGPGTVRAGDTITVSFSAGGGIYGGSGTVSFDSSQLTLKKYSGSLSGSWKVEFNGNKFVFYDNDMSSPISGSKTIFKASFTVNKNLEPGTKISVSVGSIKVTDGSKDTGLGTKTYSATIAPPLSGNCKLASLTVSNANISPAFSTGTTSYTASVPFTTSSLKVSAKAEDPDAKVTIKNTKLTAGATTTVSITVKAPNGATKTYTIKVKRAQDPNYVPSSNAKLKQLSVKDFMLSPAFSQDVQQYYVWLPYEVDQISLEAAAEDKKAEVKIGKAENLEAGKATDIPVTVTAEDEKTRITYTVTAIRAPAPSDMAALLNPQTTEPTEEPTEESTAPTEPAYTAPIDIRTDTMMIIYLIGGGILCLAMGVALGIGIKILADKKKNRKESEES
ncbi:MAG: cadherin-like beta sandwich domain-containing protein [Oscillospiraceae bacterium]|nr:cadherin-like beta sandwich domain-containing protein [Oscillospiraceae bacterium]